MSRYITPTCVVIGANHRDVSRYIRSDLDFAETFGMHIVAVLRPQQLQGLRFHKAIFTPYSWSNPSYLHLREAVERGLMMSGAVDD